MPALQAAAEDRAAPEVARSSEEAVSRTWVLSASAILWLLAASNPMPGPLPFATPAHAEDQPKAAPETEARPIDKLSVSRPTWHRGGALLYGEVTIRNGNDFPVTDVIISCDFFDEWGASIGTKATALGRPISPGRTRFSGLEFTMTAHNEEGGACRALSAEPLSGNSDAD